MKGRIYLCDKKFYIVFSYQIENLTLLNQNLPKLNSKQSDSPLKSWLKNKLSVLQSNYQSINNIISAKGFFILFLFEIASLLILYV